MSGYLSEDLNRFFQSDVPLNVNFSKTSDTVRSGSDLTVIRIAVASNLSPDKTFIYYQDLFDYISTKLGVEIELVQRKTYHEINDLIKRNEVQFGFISGLAYVEGKSDFGMQLFLMPIIQGEPLYNSYIIVPSNSNVTSFSQLKDKTFAFIDPISNSGKLSPEYILIQWGENPIDFFGFTFFTYGHGKSIQAVAENISDGAAVDSHVWNYINTTNPSLTLRTKIILTSPSYGIPPIVVSKDLDPDIRERIREILLQMHKDVEGRRILAALGIDSYSEADDGLYDSIREMRNVVQNFAG